MVKTLQAKLAKAKAKKGFTLVELIVVIAIIAVLAAILIPTLSSQIQKSKVTSCDTTASKLVDELQAYIADYTNSGGGYFTSADVAASGTATDTITIKECVTITVADGVPTVKMAGYNDEKITKKIGTFEEKIKEDITWKNSGKAVIWTNNYGKAVACAYSENADAKFDATSFTTKDSAIIGNFTWTSNKKPGVLKEGGYVVGTFPKISGDGKTTA